MASILGVRAADAQAITGTAGAEKSAAVEENAVKENTFFDTLKKALGEVNDLQKTADSLTEKYLSGEETNIHQVLLAAEKAKLAMQLTVQVRNKIVEAYQEISRMQI